MTARHIVIVGGGVSGLSAAYYLRRRLADPQPRISLIEAAPNLGGKIITADLDGLRVDTGPDAVLSRSPELRELLAELSLRERVRGPRTSGAYVYSNGRLRLLPPGAAFGIPEKLWPLLKSGLLSPLGVMRAAGDFVLPKTKAGANADDPSVADLTRPRFGNEVFDRMIQPLLGGVHAGDANQLSAKSTVPDIASLAQNSRSLYLGLGKRRKTLAQSAPTGKPQPPLVTIDGGLRNLIDALVSHTPAVEYHTATRVESLTQSDGGYAVALSDGSVLQATDVILATPAYVTSELVKNFAPNIASDLAQTPYVDVCSVTMSFRRSDVGDFPAGTGFLVPPAAKEFIVGVSWLSEKWDHVHDDEHQVVRVLVGRSGDSRWTSMSDDELVTKVRTDLARLQGLTAEPVAYVIQRWPQGMPQYTVGHAARLAALDAEVLNYPGLFLTGAAYRGVGIAGCVAQSKKLADLFTAPSVEPDPEPEGADR